MECQCKTPGFCQVLKRNMVGPLYAICQGTRLTPGKCEAYRQHWLGNKPSGPEFITVERLSSDARALAQRLPPDLTGIVGIPRSGMVPATIIATILHLPLYELDKRNGLSKLGVGNRISDNEANGKLLVVDDSLNSGKSLARARAQLPGALFAVMYPTTDEGLDFYSRIVPIPHYFEWNYLNTSKTRKFALDMDGLLCQDYVPGDDYEQFLATTLPLTLPRRAPVTIITGRHEQYRKQTEDWLKKWGVQTKKLVMRQAEERHAVYKAREYKVSECTLYVESDRKQAQEIADLSGKPVLCPSQGKFYQPVDMTCAHRGEVLRLADCNTCAGKTQIKIYSCGLWEACHMAKPEKLPNVRACLTCGDRVAKPTTE